MDAGPRCWSRVAALLAATLAAAIWAAPYTPASDSELLATLPAGAAHRAATPAAARTRVDVALPLAQFYISRARATGDLRFLGYADGALAPFADSKLAAVWVLRATILQGRHEFAAALAQLDQALVLSPEDAQARLTRAAVLRVLGRYPEATADCDRLGSADPAVATICREGVRALSGHLQEAYDTLAHLPADSLAPEARAWRASELGEMAVRLGDQGAAARWFTQALRLQPADTYTRAAYADLLLAGSQPGQALELLAGYDSMEPMLLRIALAQRALGDPGLPHSRDLLATAFEVEAARGEAVHSREQARFLLDLEEQPAAALDAALANWRTQREPIDVLLLVRAARSAGRPQAGSAAREFVRREGLEDARLAPLSAGAP
jgi:tetratricopeptide (TPR) repeat protein